MEEIKKERTVTTYDIYYKATDGTEFTNPDECRRYEESAKGVLKTRLKEITVYSMQESNLFYTGSEEYTIHGIKIKVKEHVDLVLQLCLIDNAWILKDEAHSKYIDRVKRLAQKALDNDDILLLGENYEGEFSILDTVKDVVDRLYNGVNNGPEQ